MRWVFDFLKKLVKFVFLRGALVVGKTSTAKLNLRCKVWESDICSPLVDG